MKSLLCAIQDKICDFSPRFLDWLLTNHFSKPADELWASVCAERARQRLVETEAEEEVAEPVDVVDAALLGNRPLAEMVVDRLAAAGCLSQFSSPVSVASAGHAGDETPSGSVTNASQPPPGGVEPEGTPTLTPNDFHDAAFAARSYAMRCTTDEAAAKWHRLASRLTTAM